jgi:SAM-dependent methyltransferase
VPSLDRAEQDPVLPSVAAYTAGAEDYEATHAPKMGRAVERFARSLPAGSSILDAGCGPGRDLARFVEFGHRPQGVELNPAFARRAARVAPTIECDLRQLESVFPAAAFDGIWACASLVHLNEAELGAVLAQFARLSHPGSRLYACVKSTGGTGWVDEPDGRRWYTVWDADQFAERIGAAGFAVEEVVRGPFTEVWATRE